MFGIVGGSLFVFMSIEGFVMANEGIVGIEIASLSTVVVVKRF